MLRHAVIRAVILILLGVFLRSLHHEQTDWTLEDVITQIGLGYVFLFLLWNRAWWVQLLSATVILIAYWALFAFSPIGDPDAAAKDPDQYSGFYAHWNMVDNPAHRADKWLLNKFPRKEGDEFTANYGGYYTLNFIPSLATMIFGLMAGGWLRSDRGAWQRFGGLVIAGGVMLAIGLALDRFGVCPIVKRIWTPSFAIYTGGWCLLILAILYCIIDVLGLRFWAWPFVVVGKNSIAMYAMTYLVAAWVLEQLHIHFGARPFQILGAEYQMLLENCAVAVILWLICFWMYRRQIFLRI
jgi:predicted acyltransferase